MPKQTKNKKKKMICRSGVADIYPGVAAVQGRSAKGGAGGVQDRPHQCPRGSSIFLPRHGLARRRGKQATKRQVTSVQSDLPQFSFSRNSG